MKCNEPKCHDGFLIKPFDPRARCSQKRTDRDLRSCGDVAVAVCPHCGGSHCKKHVPSVNIYDHTIKSP
jgi:hypothetical protein